MGYAFDPGGYLANQPSLAAFAKAQDLLNYNSIKTRITDCP